MTKYETKKMPILIALIMIISTVPLGLYALEQHDFILNIEHLSFSILGLVVEFMNLIAGFLVLFGSVLLVARYVRTKLESPTIPFEGTTPRLTFLTLGLEIFIGAEIINTATTRTLEDFLLLSLTIATRGLIGLILYLEKKSSSH
ncbi:DUF1622 domain-containing protein [Thermoproteota archaeon]